MSVANRVVSFWFPAMQNESQDRWQILCAQIAAEQNPQRFTHLVEELLEELRKKEAHLNASPTLPFAS